MPNAARITDMHTCPAVNPGPVPHVGGPVSSGSPNVNIGYIPAAREGDTAVCVPAVDAIKSGASNVFINQRQAARIGDPTNHGGVVVAGCATVFIGETAQSFALTTAALGGAPFCEECEKAKKYNEELRSPPAPNEPPADAALPAAASPPPAATAAVAKQPNASPDDGQNAARRAAREKVAWDFLQNHSPDLSPASIASHLGNIDLDQPVEVVQLPPGGAGAKGADSFSPALPGSAPGPYHSLAPAPPAALGLSELAMPMANGHPKGPAAPREPRTSTALEGQPTLALKSKALTGATQLLLPPTGNGS